MLQVGKTVYDHDSSGKNDDADAKKMKRARLAMTAQLPQEAFTFTAGALRMRFRPAWTLSGVGASLHVVSSTDGTVWECVRFVERSTTRFLGELWLEEHVKQECHGAGDGLTPEEIRAHHRLLNETVARGFTPLHADASDSPLAPYSFWTQVSGGAVELEALEAYRALERIDADRGVLELYARVHVPYRAFLGQHEGEMHYSMRLDLLRVA